MSETVRKRRSFVCKPGPHSLDTAPQFAIQAHDLTVEECRLLRVVVSNNFIDSEDYKKCHPVGAFLQGYEEPHDEQGRDGWVLVEFWSLDMEAIARCVSHINARFSSRSLRR